MYDLLATKVTFMISLLDPQTHVSKMAKASFLVDYGSSKNIDNLWQASPSLVILNGTLISEAFAS